MAREKDSPLKGILRDQSANPKLPGRRAGLGWARDTQQGAEEP